jgi:hypothetical protein
MSGARLDIMQKFGRKAAGARVYTGRPRFWYHEIPGKLAGNRCNPILHLWKNGLKKQAIVKQQS